MKRIIKYIKGLFSSGRTAPKKQESPLMISYLSRKQEEVDRFKRTDNKIKKRDSNDLPAKRSRS